MEQKPNSTQLENHESIVRTLGCLSGPKKKTRGGAQNRRNWKFTHVSPRLTPPHLRPRILRPTRAEHGPESSCAARLPPQTRHETSSSSSQLRLQNLWGRHSLAERRSSSHSRINQEGPQGKIMCFQD